MERWVGKVAVVTGASSGIGASISEELVNAGVKVAGLARRKERLVAMEKDFAHEKGSFHGIMCDITKEEQIINSFKWIENNLGPIYILINSAGIVRNNNLAEGNTELWKEVIDTNVLGLCIGTREAIRNMRMNNVAGHIVHINSIAGHSVVSISQLGVYSGSKFAVTALTETLRQELNSLKSKIKITSVSPGFVENEFMYAAGFLGREQLSKFVEQTALLKVKDVADAVMYALKTPPHVQVHEIIIKPVGEQH